MTKLKDIEKLKDLISKQEKVEKVSLDSQLRARACMKTMHILNEEDALLYFASVNLLNAYVKQLPFKQRHYYSFKRFVAPAIDSLIMNEINNFSFCYQPSERIALVRICGLQFSFHNIRPSEIMFDAMDEDSDKHKFYKLEDWDGIRLQKASEKIFLFAHELENLSGSSMAGDLKAYEEEYIGRYNNYIEGKEM